MFKKVLIANRGEIALRVLRACRDLGLGAVAVYSDADALAPHVRLSDEAYRLGPPSPSLSYLNADKLFEIAQRSGCDALHPGYGFLAESATFAARCVEEGLAWIGPSPHVIAAAGDKISARRAAQNAGVPIVPGTTSPALAAEDVRLIAAKIGYPIAIKAAGGGGGKGMKIARDADEVATAFDLAAKEANAYFKDPTLYVERYLARPKHIEVQILGDTFGSVVHLGERDCSLQRRHQKLVEETPASLDDALRSRIAGAAVSLAKEIGYDSAGTVEFLVEGDAFFFLEVNARIQVEHTITEMTWGVDLVKAQIRSAAGERLRFSQADASSRGHAIEARVNAESPAVDFRPSAGRLTAFAAPAGPGVRVDTAAFEGWVIPQDYDSLIAKLVVWGAEREEARLRMLRALDEFRIEGVDTTIPLYKLLLQDPSFADGTYATPTVDEFVRRHVAAIASAYPLRVDAVIAQTSEPAELAVDVGGKHFSVRVYAQPNSRRSTEGRSLHGHATVDPNRPLRGAGPRYRPPKKVVRNAAVVASPMHGIVSELRVAAGDDVADGQVIAVIEAMKMMNEVVAHRNGKVKSVEARPGDTVEAGAALIAFDE